MNGIPSQQSGPIQWASLWASGAYPACMVLAMWGAMAAVDAGIHPLMIYAIVSAITLVVVWIGEYFSPFNRDWYPNWSDNYAPDSTLFLLNNVVLQSPAVQLLIAGAAISLAGGGFELWPHHWPLWVQVPAGLIIAEFGSYWWHRAGHEIPWLWKFHALHHSPERLYWLNATRFHYVDVTLLQVCAVVPLLLLGAGPDTILFITLFSIFHGYWQHGNTQQSLGLLNFVFSNAELHRWHHNQQVALANHNYGSNLILWDLVFGSYFWPERGFGRAEGATVQTVGVVDDSYPGHLLRQLVFPFHRKKRQ
ncbi:MAG: sterol desaturase family protein [Halieaceae bacterium]|nr:sterol desaturase family protein [Halieaceae bacterium]